jgi:hypothetical protein
LSVEDFDFLKVVNHKMKWKIKSTFPGQKIKKTKMVKGIDCLKNEKSLFYL